MNPDLWYIVIAVLGTMFVADAAHRGAVEFLSLVLTAAVVLLCLTQAGVL